MEHYDSQLAQRVWQRVQNKPGDTPAKDISLLLQEESADLNRYLQLQSTMGSSLKPLLQELIRQTRQCISILRGISFLLTDTIPEAKAYPIPKELPGAALRRLYGSTLQRMRLYQAWEQHPEYGPGFQQLRVASEERCILLLHALGIGNTAGK
jgi:hypothetical protein